MKARKRRAMASAEAVPVPKNQCGLDGQQSPTECACSKRCVGQAPFHATNGTMLAATVPARAVKAAAMVTDEAAFTRVVPFVMKLSGYMGVESCGMCAAPLLPGLKSKHKQSVNNNVQVMGVQLVDVSRGEKWRHRNPVQRSPSRLQSHRIRLEAVEGWGAVNSELPTRKGGIALRKRTRQILSIFHSIIGGRLDF